jgi:hypothetical protein
MVEPIPFLGLFDEEEPVSYLREQIAVQHRMITQLQESGRLLQEALTKAQAQLLDQSTGWEMIKNPDGSFTLRPFGEIPL